MNVESHIGQYKVLRTLGSGGMGTVYLGEHLLLGRRAAIKTLPPSLSSQREIVDRFFNEARAISAIADPGVVQIFDFGYHVDGTAYIVMEYLEGESLSARLDRLVTLPLAEALRITRQIATSLGAAHARGIIHRDLKPDNVFLIRDREAQGGERTKLLDVGIAQLQPTVLVGTQLGVYTSPEQRRGDSTIDLRSDIYSLGCVLFHMLTGAPPFGGGELPPLPAVDELVQRCLQPNPDDRFQTMSELAAACEQLASTLPDESAHGDDRTVDSSGPATSWFVDSLSSVPSSEPDDDHAWLPATESGLSPFQRIMMVLVLFVGLVGGLVITGTVMDDETVAADVLELPATLDRSEPAVATTHVITPVAVEVADESVAPEIEPAPKRPHRARTHPRPRPYRKAPAPVDEPQPEDLYDTR